MPIHKVALAKAYLVGIESESKAEAVEYLKEILTKVGDPVKCKLMCDENFKIKDVEEIMCEVVEL